MVLVALLASAPILRLVHLAEMLLNEILETNEQTELFLSRRSDFALYIFCICVCERWHNRFDRTPNRN